MTNVLEKSINTGVIFVERLIGGETFKKYAESFGFGDSLGIDLAGEAVGNLKNLEEINQSELDTIALDIHVLRPRLFSAKNIDECKKVTRVFTRPLLF